MCRHSWGWAVLTWSCVRTSALRFATGDNMPLRQEAMQAFEVVVENSEDVEPDFVEALVDIALDTMQRGTDVRGVGRAIGWSCRHNSVVVVPDRGNGAR